VVALLFLAGLLALAAVPATTSSRALGDVLAFLAVVAWFCSIAHLSRLSEAERPMPPTDRGELPKWPPLSARLVLAWAGLAICGAVVTVYIGLWLVTGVASTFAAVDADKAGAAIGSTAYAAFAVGYGAMIVGALYEACCRSRR
jgi:hypothetical protein